MPSQHPASITNYLLITGRGTTEKEQIWENVRATCRHSEIIFMADFGGKNLKNPP